MKNIKRLNDANLNRSSKQAAQEADFARPAKMCRDVMAWYPDPPVRGALDTPESRAASRQKVAAELCQAIAYYNELPAKDGKKRGSSKGIAPKGRATLNPNAPTINDYKVDVDRAIAKCIKSPAILKLFVLVHILGADITKISREEQHALARAEQQFGRMCMKLGLQPRTYFISIRQKKSAAQAQVLMPEAA